MIEKSLGLDQEVWKIIEEANTSLVADEGMVRDFPSSEAL